MKKSDVFPELEPPPHGWQRMRARIAPPSHSGRWLAMASAVAVALLLVVLFRPVESVDFMPSVRALETPLEDAVVMRGEGAALAKLASSNSRVLMYRVSVLDPTAPPPPH